MTATEAERVARGLRAQLERRTPVAEVIGWKVGLNSPAVQQHLGLSRPVLGHLTTASRIEPGSTHGLEGGTRIGVEPEIAIHLGAGGAIAALGPAVEVVDLDPSLDELEAILAGNVFHRGVVLGGPVEGVEPAALAGMTATVRRNGAVAERARFAEAGEEPADVVRLIADRLALVDESPREGQVIIAGSLTPIVFVQPGDLVEVELGPLGGLSLRFAA